MECRPKFAAIGNQDYAACSSECLNVLFQEVVKGNGIMGSLTEMEVNAIRAARLSLYTTLVKIGRDKAFDGATAAEIDSVIEAVWDGLRASMQQQSATGAVPW